jgi:hypothetical protein
MYTYTHAPFPKAQTVSGPPQITDPISRCFGRVNGKGKERNKQKKRMRDREEKKGKKR